jgi:hypothetical protein
MGYRIFYSYQSDIDKKLNHEFIREAINEAKARITEFNIDPIREGFYGVGGNPPLAKAMFDESKGSDIFIGDVTFTSSKIWQSKGVKFEEDANTYLIEIDKPFKLKPAPNPNVLLETGYSWALKTHYRTILVLNEAFGSPSELPVDMKGLRWPITYKLCETRYNKAAKFKKEKKNLVNALEHAIRDAINSSIEYQIKRWRPLVINNNWKKDHKYPFSFTPNIRSKILQLRSVIINYRGAIRVCGLKGSGKTRLVLEVFQKNGDLDYNETNEQIVYHDYESVLSGDISKQLAELKDLNQSKIFVADNCSLEEHFKLSKHFKNTKVKVISISTITSLDETDNATLLIEENVVFEIFENIIKNKYPTLSVQEVINQFENNLNKFIPLIEAGMKEQDIDKSSIELLAILLESKNVEKGAIKLLSVITLFEKIGVSGEYIDQIEFIRETFLDSTKEEAIELIELLKSKGLITQKGDYVIANSFKQELIQYWKEQPIEDVNLVVKNVSNNNLWHNFSDKFFDILKNDKSGDYINSLNSREGVLKDNSFVDTNEGGEFVNLLADYFPSIAQEVIKSKIERL